MLLKNKTETILSIVIVISLCQNSNVLVFCDVLGNYDELQLQHYIICICTHPCILECWSMNLVNVFHQAFFIQATKLGNSLFIVKCLILSAICLVNNIKYRFGSPRLWINWLKSFLKHFLVFSKNFLYICVICASLLWNKQIAAIAWPWGGPKIRVGT